MIFLDSGIHPPCITSKYNKFIKAVGYNQSRRQYMYNFTGQLS